MIFRQLFDQESGTYTYVLGDPATRQALMIDPVLEQVDRYLQLLRELQLELSVAIDTHTHADHVTGLGRLREVVDCRTLVGTQSPAICASAKFADGDLITFGKLSVTAIYTPGHTDDSYSFHFHDGAENLLFTGDTLLIRGTGRTDFQNGNALDQYHSIFDKLLQFPDETLVYPGHDYKGWQVSSIVEERTHNPRLQIDTPADYEKLMASLNLPHPRLMDIAVPANQACGALAPDSV